LTGCAKQDGSCGKSDDTGSYGRTCVVVALVTFVFVMFAVMMVVTAAMIPPAVSGPRFCGCDCRQDKDA
jgi:hypothetical protein